VDRSRFAKATSAAIVAALLLAASCIVPRSIDHPPTPSVEPPHAMARNLVVTDQIKIHSGAVNIAAGFGGLWVSGFNVTARIDPVTDVIVAQISTPKTEDFSRVIVGMGSAWVSGDRGLIYRIDPDTNHVVQSIRAPLYAIGAIAVGGGDLWVGGATGNRNAKVRFVRIDPATERVVGAQIPIGAMPRYAMFVGGWLWVSTYGSILRIDLSRESSCTCRPPANRARSQSAPERSGAPHPRTETARSCGSTPRPPGSSRASACAARSASRSAAATRG
jgi:hypothetical protein